MRRRHDIVVIGGGPAGCVAARGLATLGYDVYLVSRPRPYSSFEGVATRTFEGLSAAGFTAALAALGVEVLRESHWNGALALANRERVVDRRRLDAALLEDAKTAGVTVTLGRAGRCERGDGVWCVDVQGRSRDRVEAECLVEARGRQAPRYRARRESGPATSALIRSWRLPAGRAARTALAAFSDGWAWFATGGDGLGALQLVVSSERGELPGRAGLSRHYDRLVASVGEAKDWLEGAAARGPVSARNAAPALTRPVTETRLVRVGDAALAMDPLSGHGMFEAIGSGLAAVPVVNTLLRRPNAARLARRFLEERAEHGFLRSARIGRDFYAEERRWPERRFWRRRRDWPDRAPARGPIDRERTAIEKRPVIENGYVTEREVVVTPDHPRGVWQVAGVPLAALWRYLQEQRPEPEALAAHFDRPQEAIRMAIAWLASRGVAHAEAGPGTARLGITPGLIQNGAAREPITPKERDDS